MTAIVTASHTGSEPDIVFLVNAIGNFDLRTRLDHGDNQNYDLVDDDPYCMSKEVVSEDGAATEYYTVDNVEYSDEHVEPATEMVSSGPVFVVKTHEAGQPVRVGRPYATYRAYLVE